MDKKGIVVIGPTIALITLGSLIFGAFNVIVALGFVSGLVFQKDLRQHGWRLAPRILILVVLILGLMIGTFFIAGPLRLWLSMLISALVFAILVGILSIKSIKENAQAAAKTVLILTAVYILISQLSVALAGLWI